MLTTREIIDYTEKYSVHNYDRYPLAAVRSDGVWVWDGDGKQYVDMLSTYGAKGFGDNNPRIVNAVCTEIREGWVSSMSGGFYSEPYARLVKELAEFSGFDKVLLKTGGSEAVEAALKLCKRWGYQVKKIPSENAEIISCVDNFHGRMPSALAMSTVPKYKRNFGPFAPGFNRQIKFGDADALARVITPKTAAFIVEIIQGEGGINVAPDGYFKEVQEICRKNNVLLVVDEIQTGLGRTGYNFAYEHEGIYPDVLILGKTLGGGLMPISAVLADDNVMGLIGPGDEGSTFGSHPLSCVVALEVLAILKEGKVIKHIRAMGSYLRGKLVGMRSPLVKEVRGRGLMLGVELVEGSPKAKYFCEELLKAGVICEKARDNTIRFTPPLTITKKEMDWAMERIEKVFKKESSAC